MNVAERMSRLGTESAFEVLARARALERQGKEIVHLEIGEPDFDTPAHIREAAKRALDGGATHYGPAAGLPELREAIAKDVGATRNIPVTPEEIVVTPGAKPIMYFVITALVNPGDNVLTPSPEYPLYGAVLAKLSAEMNAYDLDESNGWQPDIADMERRINARTRAILLINPNNPTGAVYSRETLEKIADLARRHNLLLFADEIYNKLIFDDSAKHISIATLAPDVPCITFNGLSKAYLVPGWRIGWGIATGPAELINPYLESVHKLLRARLCAPHAPQFAIKPALEGPQDHLK